MSDVPVDLAEIRRDLLAAIAADPVRAARRRPSRRLVASAAAFALLAMAAAAIAGGLLKSAADEEAGLVGGHQLFAGSQPSCEPLSATSFRCTLERPPAGMTFHREDGTLANDLWLGVKAVTVDASRRVDGACLSMRADGRVWACYLGQEAVERGLLSTAMLGRHQPQPPTGLRENTGRSSRSIGAIDSASRCPSSATSSRCCMRRPATTAPSGASFVSGRTSACRRKRTRGGRSRSARPADRAAPRTRSWSAPGLHRSGPTSTSCSCGSGASPPIVLREETETLAPQRHEHLTVRDGGRWWT